MLNWLLRNFGSERCPSRAGTGKASRVDRHLCHQLRGADGRATTSLPLAGRLCPRPACTRAYRRHAWGEHRQVNKVLHSLRSTAFLRWEKTRGLYVLHPLLRQYAVQLLGDAGESVEASGQHLAYFLAFAEANQAKDPAAWDRLEAVLADLMLAVETAQQLQEDEALRSLGYVLVGNSEFLPTRGYYRFARELLELMAGPVSV